jgi:hypothetical protein
MRYRKVLSRRTLLRGAGTVALGLPFIEEMSSRSVWAAPADPPVRCITIFFGLGVSNGFTSRGYGGPLEPLKPFENRIAIFRRGDMSQARGGEVHVEGGPCIFVGAKRANYTPAHASIDQVFRRQLHPDGVPTPIGTMATGFWFREGFTPQPLRCWNEDGSRVMYPIKSPSALFDALFGSFMPTAPSGGTANADALREARFKKSVLDTVLAQYKNYTGSSSPLSTGSRVKLQNHFDSLRQLEAKVAQIDLGAMGVPEAPPSACTVPAKPTDPAIGVSWTFKGGTGDGAPIMDIGLFSQVCHLQADLFAAALRCDLFRFGNLMIESAGGHFRFRGTHRFLGKSFTFGGTSQHDGYFHTGNAAGKEATAHLFFSKIAYALARFDDKAFLESNGKTVFDNSVFVIGSEVGDNHSLADVFHAVAGGGGRFRPGFYDQRVNCADVYNSVLAAYKIGYVMAPQYYAKQPIAGLLA